MRDKERRVGMECMKKKAEIMREKLERELRMRDESWKRMRENDDHLSFILDSSLSSHILGRRATERQNNKRHKKSKPVPHEGTTGRHTQVVVYR